jgi:hypothetical protein
VSASRKSRKATGKSNRKNSTISQHRRTGKILKPPFRTLPRSQSIPWLRDTFPDMIWLCSLISHNGDDGMVLAGDFLDRISSVIDAAVADGRIELPDDFLLTGGLTSFESIPGAVRTEIIYALRSDGLYDKGLPWVLARGLGKYSDLPGAWLLDGWRGRALIITPDEPERYLAKVVLDSSYGQSAAATRAKTMYIRARLQARKIVLSPEAFDDWKDLLPRYPFNITEEERRHLEPSLRATFLAFASDTYGPKEDGTDSPTLTWAKSFWRQNWTLYACKTTRDEPAGDDAATPDGAIADLKRQWYAELDDIQKTFDQVAHEVDPDLYNPDRYEVLTGITLRMLRSLAVLIRYPALWTMEHGSSITRSLLEARIVLKWLIQQNDLDLYARFKDYGCGRIKLLKLHLEEYRDGLDEPRPDLDRHIEYLDVLVNQDIWEEFQDISIEGNFAGIDTRKMAEQVGLLTEYRLLFAPASATVHGEWGALDQYVLAVCENPLHRHHRIPRSDLSIRLGPELVDSAVSIAYQLVDDYASAFTLDESTEQEDEPT